jgi:hypothetical protein
MSNKMTGKFRLLIVHVRADLVRRRNRDFCESE